MPAVSMVCDSSIVSAAIRDSLAPSVSSTTSDAFSSTDSRIDANVRSASLRKIDYKEVGSYSSVLEELKEKYQVLKPNNSNANGFVKTLTNGITKQHPALQESGNAQKIKERVRLPTPDRVLYPREKITIGWRNGPHRFNTGAGMANMGNTCYLNSSLQALLHIPSFANWLMSDQAHREHCSINNAGEFCSICALSHTLMISQEGRDVIRPVKFIQNLRNICKHMTMNRQEDAHEFLRFLLESCEQAFIKRFKENKEFDSYIKQTTPINNIFGGYFRVEIICSVCHYTSTSFQYFMDLILDVFSNQYRSIQDSLDHYFKREPLSDGWTCPQCKKNVKATKQWLIERPPIVVCVQLKKFTPTGQKVHKQIEIKQKIDLQPYMADKSVDKVTYKLVSVVNHSGQSINSGHYTASCLTESGSYYRFDDNMVNPISVNTVLSAAAYVLFYELEEPIHKSLKPKVSATMSSSSPPCTNGHRPITLYNSPNSHDTSNGVTTPVKKQSIPFIGPLLPSTISSPSASDKESEKPKPQSNLTVLTPIKSPPTTPTSNSKLVSNILSKNKLLQNNLKDENKSPSKILINLNRNMNGNSTWPPPSSASNGVGSEKKQTLPSMPNLTSTEMKQNVHSLPTTPPKTPVKSLVPYIASDDDDEEHSSLSPASSGEQPKYLSNPDKSPCVIETKAGTWKVSDNSRSSSPAVFKANGHSNGNAHNNDAISQLMKNSHQGYGTTNVSSWSGGRTAMDEDIFKEKQMERKRQMEDDRETDMDRGRPKQMKYHNKPQYNGHQNAFQEYQTYHNSNVGYSNNGFHNRNNWSNGNNNKINRYYPQNSNNYSNKNKNFQNFRNYRGKHRQPFNGSNRSHHFYNQHR